MIRNLLFGLTLFICLIAVTPVFAGGQMVSLYADSSAFVDNGVNGRVIRVYLHPEFPCKGSVINFKFVDPKDGDYINAGLGSSTYVMQQDRQTYDKDGVVASTCSTSAKFESKVLGVRQVTVDVKNGSVSEPMPPIINVDFDGQFHSDNEYNSYSYRSSTEDPYFINYSLRNIPPIKSPSPLEELKVWLLNQQITGSNERRVLIKWSALQGDNVTYDIYIKGENYKVWQKQLSGEYGPSADINIKVDQNYFVKVESCSQNSNSCTDSNELFISKMQNNLIDVSKGLSTPLPSGYNQNVEELNRKVNDLQNQLNETKKSESLLQEKINNLINFIKKLFPFFK